MEFANGVPDPDAELEGTFVHDALSERGDAEVHVETERMTYIGRRIPGEEQIFIGVIDRDTSELGKQFL